MTTADPTVRRLCLAVATADAIAATKFLIIDGDGKAAVVMMGIAALCINWLYKATR